MRYFTNVNFASEFADALFRKTFLTVLHALTMGVGRQFRMAGHLLDRADSSSVISTIMKLD